MENNYIDGFDSDGNLTGQKVLLCPHQFQKCKYQGFYGDGALFVCKLNNCIKEL